jgi:hypothetical protein
LWKTGCLTDRPHGIYGETIGCSCLGRPFKTGSKPRGKKAEAAIRTDYIDEALRDFSGYIAADELYDGPFCVLFIVDNHKFKRICYEVLDHSSILTLSLRSLAISSINHANFTFSRRLSRISSRR